MSTDYDTSDRLYFEPVTLEDVLEIVAKEKPAGVIVQYGGQTPLKLALELEANGVPIIGTTPDSIDIAEDRERFQKLLHELGLKQPPNRTARTEEQAIELAHEIGYPLVVRPSYVLGGRAMEIVHGDKDLERYMREAVRVSEKSPVLLDRFLDDAIEVDVDCVSDGADVMIGGIMEHIEQAGVHSGDSACSLPPYSLSPPLQDELRRQTTLMAKALKVVGLMNVQFAIQGEGDEATVFVLEVNPRASRTVPYVSKATGQQLAKIAARCMAGRKLADQQGVKGEVIPPYFSIKEAVFPFNKFPGVDPILGPEMRSTGEVMGVGRTFGEAMLKSQLGAGSRLPLQGHGGDHGEERRQGAGREGGGRPGRSRLQRRGDQGYGRRNRRGGHSGQGRQQGQGRTAAHRRHGEGRRDPARLQHRRRDAHRDRRFALHPHRRTCAPRHLLHDDGRLRSGDRGAEA